MLKRIVVFNAAKINTIIVAFDGLI